MCFLLSGFLTLIALRMLFHRFSLSLGYLYVILLTLSGYWFGIKGALIAATAATSIFLAEANFFRDWDARNEAMRGAPLRFISYYLSGVIIAYLTEAEKRLRGLSIKHLLEAKQKMLSEIKISSTESALAFICSSKFRTGFLFAGFIALIATRQMAQAFGFSLGYLYLLLVCLAGYWFGTWAGMISAAAASLIFYAEVHAFKAWPLRDMVVQTMHLRFAFFFTGGVIMAACSEADRNLREKFKNLSRYDELTGCVNFRWIMEILNTELSRCKRYSKEMSVIMIDIDHFKKVNDAYGHSAGNKVLRSFADIMRNNIRNIDVAGRYGGEEFIIVLPDANQDQALAVLERIKSKLPEVHLPRFYEKKNVKFSLHFSAGVSSFPFNGSEIEDLVNVADNALYEAKRSGRNKVIMEKRRWIRVKPVSSLKIEFFGSAGKNRLEAAGIANISQRGMLLAFPYDIPARDFFCKIFFSQEDAPSEIRCRIMHKEKSDEDLFLVGVHFEDISRNDEEKLSAYIKS